MADKKNILIVVTGKILKPVVKLLLRKGMSYGTFADIAKNIFVRTALENENIKDGKMTISRAAVITGLSRKEVSRVKSMDLHEDQWYTEHYNRAVRVITGWVRDKRFTDTKGNPRDLEITGKRGFECLVKIYSGDIPYRAMLDELLDSGVVEMQDDEKVKLLSRGFVPWGESDDKVHILGTDVSSLVETIDHNIVSPPEEAFYQRKVLYDNIPEEKVREIKKMCDRDSQRLLEKIDRKMAKCDRDRNPDVKGRGRKILMLGVYYNEKDFSEDVS